MTNEEIIAEERIEVEISWLSTELSTNCSEETLRKTAIQLIESRNQARSEGIKDGFKNGENNGVEAGRQSALAEKQEQVRKLKEEILDTYHKLGRANVWAVSNDCVCDLCEDFFRKKIDEIFPDVSEKQLRVSKREDCAEPSGKKDKV